MNDITQWYTDDEFADVVTVNDIVEKLKARGLSDCAHTFTAII